VLPHRRRHLDYSVSLAGRTSRDGDHDELGAVLALFDGHDDDHGPVLDALFAPFLSFAMPEIDV
jgi:hypothetical protein